MYNILICDDEKDIVSALKIYLTSEGYNCFECYNGRQAIETVAANEIHLALIDIMMPETDGFEALTEIRKISNIPIIFLTARSEDTDKILGLNVGADDYITKPFNPVEVMARIRSVLRRYFLLGGGEIKENEITVDGITVDDGAKRVMVDGEEVTLTPREYDILLFLMKNKGRVYSPKEIYRKVWNEEPFGAENAVAVHIRHLREKIEINPKEPRYIKVVWGKGYKMEDMTE